MMNGMEEKDQGQIEQATATSEYTTTIDDPSRTLAEQSPTVGDTSRMSGDHAATVGAATIFHPQGSSFQPEKYTLTMRQVQVLFKTAGIERTPRAIQRYCQVGKLDAQVHPHFHVYFVSPESVENLIAVFKQADERHNEILFREPATGAREPQATVADSSAHMRAESPTMREPSAKSREQSHEMPKAEATGEGIEELQKKVSRLEFEKRVVEEVNNTLRQQIEKDRDHYTEKITRFARLAESFKTRLKLLAAPPQSRETKDDISDVEVVEASVMGQSGAINGSLETDEEMV